VSEDLISGVFTAVGMIVNPAPGGELKEKFSGPGFVRTSPCYSNHVRPGRLNVRPEALAVLAYGVGLAWAGKGKLYRPSGALQFNHWLVSSLARGFVRG